MGPEFATQPGRGRFVPRPAFPSANLALCKWKELTFAQDDQARSFEHSGGDLRCRSALRHLISAARSGPDISDQRRPCACAQGRVARHRRGRFRQLYRPVRLWQNHVPAGDGGSWSSPPGRITVNGVVPARRASARPMAMCFRRQGFIRGARLAAISACRSRSWASQGASRPSA